VLFGVTGAQAEDFRDKVLFMRHALAPGTGDPKHFLLGDCNTRRNLSASGREQARNIGRRLKSRGIRFSKIDTNQWCRCRETGGLRGFGKYHEFIGLHSFYEDHFNQDHMLSLLRAKLSEVSTYEDPVLMATHFVTIFGITGETVGSGDMMLFDPVTGISKIFHL
jgi:hypothetical protein